MAKQETIAPLAITIGEPAGIGPDIIIQAEAARLASTKRKHQDAFAFVLGDIDVLKSRAKAMGIAMKFHALNNPADFDPGLSGVQVVGLSRVMESGPAKPAKRDGYLVIEAIRSGVDHVMDGSASGLVTCPINKKILYECGFSHPGHTEFLADLATEYTGDAARPVMMIAGPELMTVPVTIHIPLAEVSATLTTKAIVETALICADDLRKKFGIASPRLAVSGLNPHAGENGALGKEDNDVVLPAVEILKAEGIDAVGPLPADTMFHKAARDSYDVAICMYHDQALIPAKALGFDDAVNVTLGLPFIRTSPDHGTAFDIAGTGQANPSSFMAAMNLARKMARKRASFGSVTTEVAMASADA